MITINQSIINTKMKIRKKAFIFIWSLTTLIFLIVIFRGITIKWIILSANILYVFSLIGLFLDLEFFNEKTTHTDNFIKLADYNIWGVLIIVAGISSIILFIGLKTNVILILAICTLLILVWLFIRFRHEITRTYIVNGLILGGISAGAVYKFIPSLVTVFLLITSTFIAGSILNKKYPLTRIQLNKHSLPLTAKSFFTGCILAIPMAFSNLSDILTTHPYIWMNHFWQPILALGEGVMEETWLRLFLILFIYALISSKTTKKYIPILAALVISSVFFGFGHSNYINIQDCLRLTIFYGLPMGILLIRRDFETAIGYHFMIDFIGITGAIVSHN